MNEILDSISSLSDTDLRKEMVHAGLPLTPITQSTRRIFQQRLANKRFSLLRNIQDDNTVEPSTKDTTETVDTGDDRESGDPCVEVRSPEPQSPVFVVFMSMENETSSSSTPTMEVFHDQVSALKFLSQNKNGRLMRFENRGKAEEYSKLPIKVQTPPSTKEVSYEKPNNYKSLKQADLNKLLRAIEANDSEKFDELVQANPRYLINSGDGPVLLKPNPRYNPLHVAARANQPDMIRKIVSTLSDLDFQHKMYTNMSSPQETTNRIHHLLDLYFNTPEKGFFETPLHMACKFGFKAVVAELVSNPICNKTMQNKSHQTPAQVACSRASNKSEATKKEILALLEDQYYVPLMRCHDNSDRASVGHPWLPGSTEEAAPRDPRKPIPVVSALLGPMSGEDANKMRKQWMTPDRKMLQGRRMSHIRRSDLDRGDERIGRELAKQAGVPWMEYWDFIGTYADFSTHSGIQLLENYLAEQYESSQNMNNSVFSNEDSLTDLCSQLGGLQVAGSNSNSEKENLPEKNLETKTSDKENLEKFENQSNAQDWWKMSTPTHNSTHRAVEQDRHLDSLRDSLLKTRRKQLAKLSNSVDLGRLSQSQNTPLRDRNKTLNLTPQHQYNSTPVKANLFPNLIPKFQDLDSPHGDSREQSKPGLPKPNILKEELRSQNVSSTTVRNNNENSLPSSGSDLVFTPDKDQHNSPTFQPNSFILGSTPSKIDRDVILAIGNTEVSSNEFPCTWKWMKSVLSYKEADRQRWRTPKQASSAQSSYKGAPVAFTWPASPLARNRWTPIDSPMSKLALPNE